MSRRVFSDRMWGRSVKHIGDVRSRPPFPERRWSRLLRLQVLSGSLPCYIFVVIVNMKTLKMHVHIIGIVICRQYQWRPVSIMLEFFYFHINYSLCLL